MQEDQNRLDRKLLVPIETFANDMDAALAQTTLQAAGIDSIIMRDGADGMLQVLEYVEGIRLLVNEDQVDEARSVLETQATTESGEETPSA